MTLQDFSQMFNRAFKGAFNFKNVVFLFITLVVAGMIIIVFQRVSTLFSPWWRMSFMALPIFITLALLLSAGVVICRRYLENLTLRSAFFGSWKSMIKAAYVAVPFLLVAIAIWAITGFYVFLKLLPVVGRFVGVLLIFVPFLLNLSALILFFVALWVLFTLTPEIATRQKLDKEAILKPIVNTPFSVLLFFGIALFVLWVVKSFLLASLLLTLKSFGVPKCAIATTIQAFVLMLPIAAILAPTCHFFFNLSSEVYRQFEG